MKKFSYMGHSFWVGGHLKAGGVVYDPRAQPRDVSPKSVFLYVFGAGCFQHFSKEDARRSLVPQTDQEIGIFARRYCQGLSTPERQGGIAPTGKADEPTSHKNSPDEPPGRDEMDEQITEHLKEIADSVDSHGRSNEDGWYYSDTD